MLVEQFGTNRLNQAHAFTVDLPAGAQNVQFGWQYLKSTNNWFWMIDNVTIAEAAPADRTPAVISNTKAPVAPGSTATVEVGDAVLSANASGQGPVHALDIALRQCLLNVYPALGNARLSDYKVRMLDPHRGSAAKARVLAEWTDGQKTWTTAGVSDNIIEASWLALSSAVQLELLRMHAEELRPVPSEDYSWAV